MFAPRRTHVRFDREQLTSLSPADFTQHIKRLTASKQEQYKNLKTEASDLWDEVQKHTYEVRLR